MGLKSVTCTCHFQPGCISLHSSIFCPFDWFHLNSASSARLLCYCSFHLYANIWNRGDAFRFCREAYAHFTLKYLAGLSLEYAEYLLFVSRNENTFGWNSPCRWIGFFYSCLSFVCRLYTFLFQSLNYICWLDTF